MTQSTHPSLCARSNCGRPAAGAESYLPPRNAGVGLILGRCSPPPPSYPHLTPLVRPRGTAAAELRPRSSPPLRREPTLWYDRSFGKAGGPDSPRGSCPSPHRFGVAVPSYAGSRAAPRSKVAFVSRFDQRGRLGASCWYGCADWWGSVVLGWRRARVLGVLGFRGACMAPDLGAGEVWIRAMSSISWLTGA